MKGIFEERYRMPVEKRDGTAVTRDIEAASGRYLDLMRKQEHRPPKMAYFEDMVTGAGRCEEIRTFRASGGKVIGLFCNFVPEELIIALGGVPLRLCSGAYPAVSAAEELLARDVCPLVKSSFGLRLMGVSYWDLVDLVIMPTSCDAKKKCSRFFNNLGPTWTLDLPQSKDYDKNLPIWVEEIRALKEKLEGFFGKKLTKEALADAIRLVHKRTEVFRRFHDLRKQNPRVISGRDTLLAIQSSFYDDPKRWTANFTALTDEVEAAMPTAPKEGGPRILLTGAPVVWPNWKLLNTIEEAGAVVAADTLCSGTNRLFDPVEVDEWTYDGMLRALAVKHLFPSICPCFIENAEHIDRLLELAEDFHVDGVIYHNLRLCQLFDMEYNHVSAVLKKKGVPVLNITTDLSPEDEGQIRTRVEAFLEMLGERI